MLDACTGREDLHLLVERIPESALLAAPPDDEPISEHESAAWDADERRRQRGEAPASHVEMLGELGLTESDLR